MDAKTLDALKGSIAKWEAIVAGTGESNGTSNCPLCQMFVDGEDGSCRGCPVMRAMGQDWCDGSPYTNFDNLAKAAGSAFDDNGNTASRLPPPEHPLYEQVKAAAQAELDFLRYLLPV